MVKNEELPAMIKMICEFKLHAATLKENSSADIFYDAAEHGDTEAEKQIDATTEAMEFMGNNANAIADALLCLLALVNAPSNKSKVDVSYWDGPEYKQILAQGADDYYVIYSANEAAISDGAGFWSNEDGWCYLENATLFDSQEIVKLKLPISTGNDAKYQLAESFAPKHAYSMEINDQRHSAGQLYVSIEEKLTQTTDSDDGVLSVICEIDETPKLLIDLSEEDTGANYAPCLHIGYLDESLISVFKKNDQLLLRPESGVQLISETLKNGDIAYVIKK